METLCKIFNSYDLWLEAVPRKIYFTDLYFILKSAFIFDQISTIQNIPSQLYLTGNILKIILLALEFGRSSTNNNISFDSNSQNLLDNSIYFYFSLIEKLENKINVKYDEHKIDLIET